MYMTHHVSTWHFSHFLSFESKDWLGSFCHWILMLGWCLWRGRCFFFWFFGSRLQRDKGWTSYLHSRSVNGLLSFTTWYSVSPSHAADLLQTSKFRVNVIHVKKQFCSQAAACLKWQRSWDKALAFCPLALWVHLEVRCLNESLLFTRNSVPPAALSPFLWKKERSAQCSVNLCWMTFTVRNPLLALFFFIFFLIVSDFNTLKTDSSGTCWVISVFP